MTILKRDENQSEIWFRNFNLLEFNKCTSRDISVFNRDNLQNLHFCSEDQTKTTFIRLIRDCRRNFK